MQQDRFTYDLTETVVAPTGLSEVQARRGARAVRATPAKKLSEISTQLHRKNPLPPAESHWVCLGGQCKTNSEVFLQMTPLQGEKPLA